VNLSCTADRRRKGACCIIVPSVSCPEMGPLGQPAWDFVRWGREGEGDSTEQRSMAGSSKQAPPSVEMLSLTCPIAAGDDWANPPGVILSLLGLICTSGWYMLLDGAVSDQSTNRYRNSLCIALTSTPPVLDHRRLRLQRYPHSERVCYFPSGESQPLRCSARLPE
jgi:hypothetical protein